ncbi:MAG: hypothetical protein M3R47_19330 [Chloroflexota bacterium]|nr:hypothetical protein [Chloroflexota bacterium]
MTSIRSYLHILPVVLLLALIAIFFLAPGWAGAAAGIALIISFAISTFLVVHKQMTLYKEKPTSRARLARNILFEITGVLLAILLAGLLGRYIAQIGTAQISHDLTRLIAGIVIGLLTGMGVGFLVKRTWGRLVKTSPAS